jgi:hypothetical protein
LSGEKSVEKNSSTPASPMFGGMFGATPSESGSSTGKFEFAPEPEPAKESAGEFTQFFRSPFEQPGAPSRPLELPDEPQVKPAREQTGDFTRVFGKGIGEEVNEAFRISPPQSEPPQPAGSFTRIFGEGGAKLGTARLDTGDADPGSFQPLAGPTAPPVDLPPAFSTRPPLIPQPPPPTFTPPPVTNVPSSTLENSFLNRSGRSDATEVFKTPGGDAAPEMQGFSSGPSEFTQFLSRSQINAALPPEPAIAPPPAPSGSPFGAPAIPKPPAFQFAPPPPPPPPAVPAIPRPAFAVPQPPAVKAPAGPTSYWPLITVLTILLAVAIILIMYFALKH